MKRNARLFELSYSNKYGDNWIQYYIDLGGKKGVISIDFHCDIILCLNAYMEDVLPMLPTLTRKSVTDALLNAIKVYGVGKLESDKRNQVWRSK